VKNPATTAMEDLSLTIKSYHLDITDSADPKWEILDQGTADNFETIFVGSPAAVTTHSTADDNKFTTGRDV
jgi:hypothetical protein